MHNKMMRLSYWLTTALLWGISSPSLPCTSVPISDAKRVDISRAGKYCLEQDITIPGEPFAWLDGGERPTDSYVFNVGASDVTIDLKGQTIRADRLGLGGIMDRGRHTTPERFAARLSVGNGALYLPTGGGIRLMDLYGSQFMSLASEAAQFCSDVPSICSATIRDELEPVKKMRMHFPETAHRVENVEIKAKKFAIQIKGAGNVLQSNQLLVTGCSNDVYLIGPRQVVENNTIVARGGRCSRTDAPIKLHAGDNSIIRNNTIIIEGWGDKPDAAISIIDSKNVLIENNKIIGTKTLYKIWDEEPDQKSSVVERGNEFVSGLGRFLGR